MNKIDTIKLKVAKTATRGCVAAAICSIAPLSAFTAELTDDFTGGLGDWTSTVILDTNGGESNTLTWQVNASDQLELVTSDFDSGGVEQVAYIRSGATLAVGEEARVSLSLPLLGNDKNDSLGVYVGGTAPTFGVRQDYVNVYAKSASSAAFTYMFDGTTPASSNPYANNTSADTFFVARTAENEFELGYYVGATRTVIVTRTPTTANSANYIGIYADTRAAGTISSVDSFQITSEPIDPEPVEPPVVAQPSNKKIYVILFGGQSNAEGWGYHQYLLDEDHPLKDPQMDVEMYAGCGTASVLNQLLPLQSGSGDDSIQDGVMQYPELTNAPISRFGPELTMARTVRDGIDILDSKVVILKYAVGGKALFNAWYGDGTADTSSDKYVYKAFQTSINGGLAEIQALYPYHEIEIIGMGWVQGESDRFNASTYESNLTRFIADVRATFATNMVFVLSRLSMNQIEEDDDYYDSWQIVRAAQAAVAAADPLVVATETEGTNYPCATGFAESQIHFTAPALLQIGEDLGQALLSVLEIDADGDQLPDDWEESFGSSGADELGNALDDDFDGDGITDRNEFRIGTSPVDPEDGLSLSITNAATIQWPAKRGISYSIQHSTNLVSWSVLDTVLLETNGAAVFPISGVVSNPSGFYSLEVEM